MSETLDARLAAVAHTLWRDVYETRFRGRDRGLFLLSRRQLRRLVADPLDAATIDRFRSAALATGLVVIDLDDRFACLEVAALDRARRVPDRILDAAFAGADAADARFDVDDEADAPEEPDLDETAPSADR